MSESCDHCGHPSEVLHAMHHVPGLNIGKYFRPQLWCGACAGVGPGEVPPCPSSLLRADGSCTVCEPLARVG